MGTEAEEAAAIEALDGAEWMGRNLKVNWPRRTEVRLVGEETVVGILSTLLSSSNKNLTLKSSGQTRSALY